MQHYCNVWPARHKSNKLVTGIPAANSADNSLLRTTLRGSVWIKTINSPFSCLNISPSLPHTQKWLQVKQRHWVDEKTGTPLLPAPANEAASKLKIIALWLLLLLHTNRQSVSQNNTIQQTVTSTRKTSSNEAKKYYNPLTASAQHLQSRALSIIIHKLVQRK